MGNASDDTTSALSPATAGASAVAAPPSAEPSTAASLTLDDRSRPFKLMSPVELGKAMHEANATGKADVFAALMQAYSARVPGSKWRQVLSRQYLTRMFAPFVGVLLVACIANLAFPLPSWVIYVWPLMMFAGVFWALHAPPAAEDQQAYCAAMASRDLCRNCAYDMQRLTPDADGCVACPECGSAWRLTLQGRALEQLDAVRAAHPTRKDRWSWAVSGHVIDAAGIAQPCVPLARLNEPAITALARTYATTSRLKYIAAMTLAMLPACYFAWHKFPILVRPALSVDWLVALVAVLCVVFVIVQLPLLVLSLRTDSAIFAPATALAAIQNHRCPACTAKLAEPATDPAASTSVLSRPAHHRTCTTCSAVWDTKTKPKRVGWV
jgi:hypothetical protein